MDYSEFNEYYCHATSAPFEWHEFLSCLEDVNDFFSMLDMGGEL